MKIPFSRHTPVAAIVAGCLLLGTTGGAVAGSMITGKQIKDNTVSTKDIKNKTILKKDMADKTVKKLKGATGPAGPAGATGPAGPRGFSAWDKIPSGVTASERFFETGREYAIATQIVENINFPGVAPAAPIGYGFGPDAFAGTTTDLGCTGTVAAPTAPAGHVCVYLGGLENLTAPAVLRWDDVAQAPYTFYLNFTSTPNTAWRYWGSWAYRAP